VAQRQFLLVRPEHRLVADALEQQWNEKLARSTEAEETYRKASPGETGGLDLEDRGPRSGPRGRPAAGVARSAYGHAGAQTDPAVAH
jgi:hypothetical protein